MIHAIIIEDEPISAKRLERLIKKIDQKIDIIQKITSVEASIEWLSNHQPDLIFLDIHLSDGNAFAIFDKIKVESPIIFTTAYDEFALQAFRQNSIDYLLKPINEKELTKALEKYNKFFHKAQHTTLDYQQLLTQFKPQPSYKKRFLIHVGQKLKTVEVENVAYFYSQDKTTFLVTLSGQSYPIDFSLTQLKKLLNPNIFFKINRQFLIHSQSIKEMHYISKSRIKIELNPKITKVLAIVAIEKVGQFKNWLKR